MSHAGIGNGFDKWLGAEMNVDAAKGGDAPEVGFRGGPAFAVEEDLLGQVTLLVVSNGQWSQAPAFGIGMLCASAPF